MPNNVIPELIDADCAVFDALREVFKEETERCFLLRRNSKTKDFGIVRELTSGYWYEWEDQFRQTLTLFVARSDTDFGDEAARGSYIAIGCPDDQDRIPAWAINGGSEVPHDGTEPSWSFLCTKLPNEWFTIAGA